MIEDKPRQTRKHLHMPRPAPPPPRQRYRVHKAYGSFNVGDEITSVGTQRGHIVTVDSPNNRRRKRLIPLHHVDPIYEGSNITMISFARFLAEAPYYTEVDKDHENASTERLVHTQDKEVPWKKIGTIGDHEVHKQRFARYGATSYRLVHPNTNKVAMHLDTEDAHGGEQVTMVSGIKNSPIKAHEFYHHLITKQGVELHSDTSQSPGGVHIWKKLHEMPGVKIKHISNINGKERTLHTGNDWGKNYGFNSYFAAKKA